MAPETVFGMTQQGEPRRSVLTAFRAVVGGQDAADHILVDIDAKGLGQVLGDLRAAKTGIAPLELWRSAELTHLCSTKLTQWFKAGGGAFSFQVVEGVAV